jgi:hypothetical protein
MENKKVICSNCKGTGKQTCYICLGRGTKKISRFMPTNKFEIIDERCINCDGKGKIICGFCGGEGYTLLPVFNLGSMDNKNLSNKQNADLFNDYRVDEIRDRHPDSEFVPTTSMQGSTGSNGFGALIGGLFLALVIFGLGFGLAVLMVSRGVLGIGYDVKSVNRIIEQSEAAINNLNQESEYLNQRITELEASIKVLQTINSDLRKQIANLQRDQLLTNILTILIGAALGLFLDEAVRLIRDIFKKPHGTKPTTE